MSNLSPSWDYLLVTAANDRQAAAYESQIRLRKGTGHLTQFEHTLVVADPHGCRVGSGGSTLQCLLEVIRLESSGSPLEDFEGAEALLRKRRILIVHAGGDSRRLPAYSACGKIFVPLPGEATAAIAPTLFDRLIQIFSALPASLPGAGQIVVASGDALILFDPSELRGLRAGITALASTATPKEASRHGVFCANQEGSVRLYLQKPDLARQSEAGAIARDGYSLLDIGVMIMDASSAVQLLRSFCGISSNGKDGITGVSWTPSAWRIVLSHGIDLYREICAALGTEATLEEYLRTVRSSGSQLDEPVLAKLFDGFRKIHFNLQVLSHCNFLHFGTSSQLITSGLELLTRDKRAPFPTRTLAIGTIFQNGSEIEATDSWVEGCRIQAPLRLPGRNVLIGVDVGEPFELPAGTCLDMSTGVGREGRNVWFIRYYHLEDTFKQSVTAGATFCGRPLEEWLRAVGISHSDVWPSQMSDAEKTLWNARVVPAENEHDAFRRWSWMLDVDGATAEQKRRFQAADRYSSAEIATRVDQEAFHARRSSILALKKSPREK